MKRIFTFLLMLSSMAGFSQSTTVVISQAYPGGGSSSATVTYKTDYVELHNISNTTQNISDFSLQYGSSSGNFGASSTQIFVFPAATTIPAGGYLLVQLGSPGTGGADLPVTPDFTTTNLSMSASSGKVALVNNPNALGCGATAGPCTLPSASIVDLVSYGASNNGEGGTTVNNGVALPANTNGCVRKASGCTETDNNNADFDVVVGPVPRNSATAVLNCSSGPAPGLSASALTSFGNVCTGTTAGPNSFTISGVNLSTANVTVAALAGFTYSTTAGGTYTTTLSITQAGGSLSQDVFVKFSPVAVQSYNGNISVDGGGVAVPITVAATGSGVTSMVPTLTTGAATSVTTSSATLAGTITGTGCSAITAYGIEYSASASFPNGSGTAVPSTNLNSGNFSSDLSTLASGTTYYYHAYATNSTGTGYGPEQSFTTTSTTAVTGIVISQVYGGGGGSTGTYKNDYVELHNNGTTTQLLDGLSVQYGSSTGNFGSSSSNVYAFPSGTSIPAGGYLLIQLGATGSGGVDFPVTPDLVTGNLSMSGSSGKVVLANQATALGCGATATPCTLPSTTILDLVAYGAANNAEGGASANNGVAITATDGAIRKNNGCTDTDNNNADFDIVSAPVPRNSASTLFSCNSTPTPTISTTSLTAFGNICTGTTAGPNSFTISGNNLTNANITVGPLTGYTFATTSAGTYTNSLSLVQPGGTYSQTVYVKFSPVAVQSYNGDIIVNGGGIPSAVNVAAVGAGINTGTTVSSGAASAITFNSATVAGTITATGCTPVTAYGIAYSTTSGFTTGTQVASGNLTGSNFSSNLSGLAANTTYYYKAYAVSGSGTAYGAELSFTTLPPPVTLTATTLAGFGDVCDGSTAGPNSFTLNGSNLTTANVVVGPLAGYSFATTAGGTYSTTLSITQPGGTFNQAVYVKFFPVVTQSYNGNIPVSGGGATTFNVPVTGNGVFTTPVVTTGTASNITTRSATLGGNVGDIGCGVVNDHGIEYSGINGFANGSGTYISAGSIISNAGFTVSVSGLVQGVTYYYKAYARNNGGTSYGSQQSFTAASIKNVFTLYPSPVASGGSLRVTMNNLTPGYYGVLFYNSTGQLAYQKNINIQAGFIDQDITVPATMPAGIYRVQLVNNFRALATLTIVIAGQ